MRCRDCGAPQPIGLSYVCPACFGPLEVDYDYAVVGAYADPRGDRGTRARHLALRRAPPGRRAAGARAAGRVHAAAAGRPPGADARARPAVDQGRHPQPVAVASRTGRSRSPRRGRVEFGVEALACASTGNLAGATAAAAAAVGLPAYVFIPADLEPAKVDHALAYGATVVPIDGTYDDVNRLCLEVADETGWGFVNINLRPFYAEGSKTLAYEIAESLGWRSPDVVVAPVASGAMFTRVARGFEELAELGPDRAPADPVRRRPGRRLRAGRDGVGRRDRRHRAGPRRPTRSSARWPSATRPTAATSSSWRTRPAARSRPSRTRSRRRRSATSRGSRGSTRRRPAA